MGLSHEHEIHRRRFGRNIGLGLLLGGFVALVFALTVAKVSDDRPTQAFDHSVRIEQVPVTE